MPDREHEQVGPFQLVIVILSAARNKGVNGVIALTQHSGGASEYVQV